MERSATRRSFLAAIGAMCLSSLEAIASYVDPRGWHRHECPKCKYIWTHKSGSHNCPNIVNGKQCSGYENYWYTGDRSPGPLVSTVVVVEKPYRPRFNDRLPKIKE